MGKISPLCFNKFFRWAGLHQIDYTKFGQYWFKSLGAMACDERTYGWTDGRTYGQTGSRGSYFVIEEHFKTNPMKIGLLQLNLF